MKIVKETLRKLIKFSEEQRAAQIRQLKSQDKSQDTATVVAYKQIIDQLSAILPAEDEQNEET